MEGVAGERGRVMGRYVKKNLEQAGVHCAGRIEKKVLEAWKRGERSVEEIAEITKLPLKTIYKYIPERIDG